MRVYYIDYFQITYKDKLRIVLNVARMATVKVVPVGSVKYAFKILKISLKSIGWASR